MTSIICVFKLAHLKEDLFDELFDDVFKEVNYKEALKSSIFVVQRATAPKNGVEFRQGSIGTSRSNLATLYDVWRRRQFSTNQRPRNDLTPTDSESTYCQALLYEQRLQKVHDFIC